MTSSAYGAHSFIAFIFSQVQAQTDGAQDGTTTRLTQGLV